MPNYTERNYWVNKNTRNNNDSSYNYGFNNFLLYWHSLGLTISESEKVKYNYTQNKILNLNFTTIFENNLGVTLLESVKNLGIRKMWN